MTGTPAVGFLFFMPAQVLVQGMGLPKVEGVCLLTSHNFIQIIPYRHGWRCVSWVILDPGKLTTESNLAPQGLLLTTMKVRDALLCAGDAVSGRVLVKHA